MYNKILDIDQKGKQSWYTDTLPENMTRIEFEFYPPYSNINTSDSMISYCCDKIFGYPLKPLGLVYRPDMGFKLENAYEYFVRYAKSKGVSIDYLIKEMYNYHLTIVQN